MLESASMYVPFVLLYLVICIFKLGAHVTLKDIIYLEMEPYNIRIGKDAQVGMFNLNRIIKVIYFLLGITTVRLILYM